MTKEPSDAETCLHVSISEANKSSPVRGMTSKASAARMSILILIAEPQQSDHEVEWQVLMSCRTPFSLTTCSFAA